MCITLYAVIKIQHLWDSSTPISEMFFTFLREKLREKVSLRSSSLHFLEAKRGSEYGASWKHLLKAGNSAPNSHSAVAFDWTKHVKKHRSSDWLELVCVWKFMTAFQWVHLSSYNKASIDNNFECDWKPVNKGTTQGSVRGPYRPYLFKMFLNNLNITLGNHDVPFKNADDSTIIAPVWKDWHYSDQLVSPFLDWTKTNGMSCNPSKQSKWKELTTRAIMALVDNQKER